MVYGWQELLAQSGHYSHKVRKDALHGLSQLLQTHPEELRQHVSATQDHPSFQPNAAHAWFYIMQRVIDAVFASVLSKKKINKRALCRLDLWWRNWQTG